ncbi:MAG: hypothetical protein ACK5FV_06335, partial [Bacteroidota bacterium]
EISKENYESKTVKLSLTPRFKAVAKDLLLGSVTYGIPLFVDIFRSDFYKISPKSKILKVNLDYTQGYM